MLPDKVVKVWNLNGQLYVYTYRELFHQRSNLVMGVSLIWIRRRCRNTRRSCRCRGRLHFEGAVEVFLQSPVTKTQFSNWLEMISKLFLAATYSFKFSHTSTITLNIFIFSNHPIKRTQVFVLVWIGRIRSYVAHSHYSLTLLTHYTLHTDGSQYKTVNKYLSISKLLVGLSQRICVFFLILLGLQCFAC